MDKEYAVCFKDKFGNNLQEIGIGRNKAEAMKSAKYYLGGGATQMTVKLYQEGDLVHQWDWINGKWVQYE